MDYKSKYCITDSINYNSKNSKNSTDDTYKSKYYKYKKKYINLKSQIGGTHMQPYEKEQGKSFIKILSKFLIQGRKIVKIKLDTNYFTLLPDNISEIYAYKSSSGILWHLVLIEEGKQTFKKHPKSYTTGFVLNFEIQQYLENDKDEYSNTFDKTVVFGEIIKYTSELLKIGIDKVSEDGCKQTDFKFFEEPDNKEIKYYQDRESESGKYKWMSSEYTVEQQTMKYDCPIIYVQGSYYPDYYMSKSVKELIETIYGDISNILEQISNQKKILEFTEKIYSEIGDEISELMEQHFEVIEEEKDREPIYNGTFRIESDQTNYSLFSVKIKSKISQKEYVLYFILYYVRNVRMGTVDKYNLPIIILDIKNDNSKDFIYKNCVISTGLYTCKPYEYRQQSLQIFDSGWVIDHRDISGSRHYTLVSKYLSNMWPLNKLKMIEGIGHELKSREKEPKEKEPKAVSENWWSYY